MASQPALPGLRDAIRKVTRRGQFLFGGGRGDSLGWVLALIGPQ
jgi:hypothetical protein